MASDALHTIGAFAVILDADDQVLLSHRRDSNLWNLPGGRVQVDELPNDAAVREVREETGLLVEVRRLVGVYGRNDQRADLVFTFECEITGGELVATDEADRHQWYHLDQLPANTIPKQVARIRDAIARRPMPVFRTLHEPSGKQWLETLKQRGFRSDEGEGEG